MTPSDQADAAKVQQGRTVAHYQVLLTAWLQTRMEHDKALVTISSAGFGLMFTLPAITNVRSTFEFFTFVIGVLAFALCIFASLRIYRRNADLIEAELRNSSQSAPNLRPYDYLAIGALLVGVTSFVLVGILGIINKYLAP